jgi:hypothetical protein
MNIDRYINRNTDRQTEDIYVLHVHRPRTVIPADINREVLCIDPQAQRQKDNQTYRQIYFSQTGRYTDGHAVMSCILVRTKTPRQSAGYTYKYKQRKRPSMYRRHAHVGILVHI